MPIRSWTFIGQHFFVANKGSSDMPPPFRVVETWNQGWSRRRGHYHCHLPASVHCVRYWRRRLCLPTSRPSIPSALLQSPKPQYRVEWYRNRTPCQCYCGHTPTQKTGTYLLDYLKVPGVKSLRRTWNQIVTLSHVVTYPGGFSM
jgi:hypothetical protein